MCTYCVPNITERLTLTDQSDQHLKRLWARAGRPITSDCSDYFRLLKQVSRKRMPLQHSSQVGLQYPISIRAATAAADPCKRLLGVSVPLSLNHYTSAVRKMSQGKPRWLNPKIQSPLQPARARKAISMERSLGKITILALPTIGHENDF